MPSGSRSLDGTVIIASLPPLGGSVGIAEVMSLAVAGDSGGGGGITMRAPSSVFGVEELFDCLSSGVGEIIEGAAGAGIAAGALFSAGGCAGGVRGSTRFSIAAGACGALLP